VQSDAKGTVFTIPKSCLKLSGFVWDKFISIKSVLYKNMGLNELCVFATATAYADPTMDLRLMIAELKDVPEDVITVAGEYPLGNTTLSKLWQTLNSLSGESRTDDFRNIMIEQAGNYLEENKPMLIQWMRSFDPTASSPVYWAANGTPMKAIGVSEGQTIALPR